MHNQNSSFLEKMRASAKLAANTLEYITPYVKEGVTTNHLNDLCHDFITGGGAKPAPLGYHGFPKSICTSVNKVVCHGIPDDQPLKKGDILNIDVSLSKEGAFSDTCTMFFIGKPSVMAKRIVQCAKECLYIGINEVKPGASLGNIGRAIEAHAKKYRYSVVREFCGHGIGHQLHQEPQVLHFAAPVYDDFILEEGMTFTIEPMINVGKAAVKTLSDGWTVITRDHSLSAQFEHTILVTKTGWEVLTLRDEENPEDIASYATGFQ